MSQKKNENRVGELIENGTMSLNWNWKSANIKQIVWRFMAALGETEDQIPKNVV